MERLLEFLEMGQNVLDLAKDIEVVEALEEVVQTWKDNQAAIATLGVSGVFELISSVERDVAFFEALNDLGLDGDAIRAKVTVISNAVGNIPEPYRKLAQRLSEFDEQTVGGDPGLVPWKILDVGKARQGSGTVDYAFDIGTTASIELEAGDTWPRNADSMPDNLLRLGIRGDLEADASASLPLKVGSVTAGARNPASAALDYYFHPESRDVIFAAAVVRRLGNLRNPFSLDSVWKDLMHTDLNGVIAQVDGSTGFSLDIGIAEGFTIAGELATAGIGLTVGATVKRSGAYALVLRTLPPASDTPQMIEATLTRNTVDERGRRLALGVTVDLSGLAGRLRAILKRHHGALQSVLDDYAEFLTPGTYLREKLHASLKSRVDEVVGDDALRDVLKDAVGGALGVDAPPTPAGLRKLIESEIVDALDGAGQVVTGHATAVAREVVARLADKFQFDTGPITEALESRVQSLVEELQGDLATSVGNLSGPALRTLADALNRAGVATARSVASADEALAGVREILGKYEGLLKRLIAETENAARTRIVARLTHEQTRTSGHSVDVRMLISRNNDATTTAFETLVRGDMDGIVQLLREGVPGIDFDRENMALSRFASIDSSLGFELVFLGFEFGSQSIFEAEARVTSDGAGRVSVVSNATWLKRKSTPREERNIRFVDAFELTAASATRRLNIDLGISHLDESLRLDEVDTFLRSFESAGLLATGTTDRAREVFVGWAGPGEDRKIAADINLSLQLNDKASRGLMQLGERANGNLTDSCRRKLFRVAIRELVESGAYSAENVAEVAEGVRAQTRMEEGKLRVDVLYDYTPMLHQRTTGSANLSPTFPAHQRRIRELERAHRIHKLCIGFVEFVDVMGDIYQAEPAFDDANGWTESEYLDAQKTMDGYIRDWLKIESRFLFWIGDEAHPRTVAFVGALVALAGSVQEEGPNSELVLSLVRRDGTPDEVTLV